MKSWCKITLISLLCVSTAYGGVRIPKGGLGGKILSAISRKITTISQKQPKASTSVQIRSAQSTTPVAGARLRPETIEPSLLTTNILSRSMQRQVAQEARPYLYELDWVRVPRQPSSHNDVNAGIRTLGNLTRMSDKQYAEGKEAYEQAVDYMQEVSKSINAEIYYLGTSEAEALTSLQITKRFNEISQGERLVADAQAIWGYNYTLNRIAKYWKNMRDFYTVLSTGIYHPIGKGKLEAFKRLDGHVYVTEEFGLTSEGIEAKIPQADWKTPATWLSSQAQGALPPYLRVAVLQDDADVIASLKNMKKKAGLRGWELDFYDADVELFLGKGVYEKYDMILTDVLMKNGGGRYLARQLRSRGYEGSILTLSGFEITHGGEDFFNDGIDGMIELGWTPNLTDRIWARLNNYFILKEKYGWQH